MADHSHKNEAGHSGHGHAGHEPSGHGHGGHGHGEHFAHPAPVWILFGTFFALICLTVLTVYVADNVELGSFELVVSMGIATVKSVLVGAFFMHMYWDKGFNVLVFLSSVLFFALFIGYTLMDSYETLPNVTNYYKTK
ncbi:MAG: cytochrome C oxidase subunit IV family protein [Planctomycetaceae bacterium]|jgi:cytochrome c oxidase subunit IV|nr:cytochrome C oxidase subunit IV family protein [Planctomycetaceae bacterium]